MKKTLILTGALVAILALGTVFYNNYQKNDPSKLGPAGIYSQLESDEEAVSENTNSDTSNASDSDKIAAMDFTVYDQSGNPVKLSDFYGKPIIVNFWATWCGPCKSELPAFDALSEKYKDEISFLMVNLTDGAQETVSGVSKFILDNDYHFPVYFDTGMDAATTYSVYSIPTTLFIDADGNIVASHMGSMSETTLENYITNYLIP